MWYEFLPRLFNMSITGGIIIVLVLLVRLLLCRVPKVFSYALWAVVLFRLLCPVSLSSVLSVFQMMETPISSSGSMEYIPENIVRTENPATALPHSDISGANSHTLIQGEEKLGTDALELIVSAATYLWAFGAIVLFGYSMVKLVLLKQKLVGAIPLPDSLQSNMYLADHITTPFVIGLFSPKIYLPSTLADKERSYIIRHEQYHIRRLDHVVKILAFLALCIHWFNPLVWVAFVISGNDMEMSCDEAVMKRMSLDVRVDYTQSLLSLATGHRIISGTPLAFGEGNTKGRIKNVLNYKKPTFWITLIAVAACVIVSVCFLTNPIQSPVSFHSVQITWAKALDMRSNEATMIDLNSSELDELKSRLRNLKIGRKEESLQGVTPLYSLSIQAQQTPQFMIAGYHEDGDIVALLYEDSFYHIDDVDFSQYLSDVCSGGVQTDAARVLTLDEVVSASLKGEALTWTDFNGYFYTETGFGLYIRVYEIDEQFSLWIGGGSTDEMPIYIRLISNGNQEGYIDIRTENVKDFIAEHSGSISTEGGMDEVMQVTESIAPLDAAISTAILEHNKGDYLEGDFACESHAVLLQSSAGRAGGPIDTVTIYAMVLYQEYKITNDGIQEVSGSHIPTSLTFQVSKDGEYTLTKYWIPRDGSYYAPDLREEFPAEIVEDALDTQKYILEQIQNCYAQAVEYSKLDTDTVIETLLDTIITFPAASSNPAEYIDAHPIEYRELTYYSDYTLKYVFSEFLKGNQTDLRGKIMSSVMDTLLGGATPKTAASNGQEYFEAWRANMESLYEENGMDDMLKNHPKGWLLIKIME